MMKVEDGGPAFPVEHSSVGYGMSLRDYFAAVAMNGLYAGRPDRQPLDEKLLPADAGFAYQVADAMLAERAKTRS